MMMKVSIAILCSALFSWILAVVAPAVAQSPADVAVTLDRTVHFEQPDGQAVDVEATAYRVERNGEALRLVPEGGGTPVVLLAERLPLEVPVEEPMAALFARSTDDHLLIYADPQGDVVGIRGSYSGIRTREIVPLSQVIKSQTVSGPMQLPGGNILPGLPRIRSASYFSFAHHGALVPFANVNLTIALHNVLGSPGTRIQYRIVPPGSITGQPACTLTRNPRVAASDSFQLDQNGEGRISLSGWFASAGSCAVGIELMSDGKPDPARLVAGPFQVQPPQRYVLSETARLKATLGVRVSSSLGICEGTSIGPANYSVGVVENGADLAFRIRSGPIGTECQYISKAWSLPDGVRLGSIRWESVREIPPGQEQGKCCVVSAFGNDCITMPLHSGFNFTRGTVPVVTGEVSEAPPYYSVTSTDRQILEDGVIIFDNSSPRVVTVVKPLWGKLQCTNTLVNDHGVKLVLRELVLIGPPGLTFP